MKRLLAIALLLLLNVSTIISFSGCGSGNANTKETDKKGIRVVNEQLSTGRCYNNQGLYYINLDDTLLNDFTYGHHIMYIDFATRQEVYLCNNSGCNHNTKECTSVSTDVDLFSSIFLGNDHLYILKNYPDYDGFNQVGGNSGGIQIETSLVKLYCMNPDGTDRREVYKFDRNLTVEDIVLADENNLYFVTKKIQVMANGDDKYLTAEEKNLTRLDTSTWEAEDVISLIDEETNCAWKVIGGYDSSIILQRTLYDHKITAEERIKELYDDELRYTNWENSKEQIAVVDLEDKSLKIIYSIKNTISVSDDGITYSNYYYFVQEDDILYIYPPNEDMGHKIDLKTGDDETVENIMLEDESDFNDNEFPDSLKAETDDYYLFTHNCDVTENGDNSWIINQYNYALISKKDYEEGNDNYLPIEMISSGDRSMH